MAETCEFQKKPIPWMYSPIGSMVAIALMKLAPVHRQLTELEIRNIQDYFNSEFVRRRQRIGRLGAFLMTYWGAIQRMLQVSRLARQDYYALNRRGSFAANTIPTLESPLYPDSPHLPLIIVPGLNTPPVFFREMHGYFTRKGYNVSVLTLPQQGLSDVATSANALRDEVDRLKHECNVSQVNVVGHCLGGLVAHYWVDSLDSAAQRTPIRNLVALGTGFLGAEGVRLLKEYWIPRNPNLPVPRVFDELIQWNVNIAKKSSSVAYHSLLTVFDFMVHFRKGLLQNPEGGMVTNHIIEDPAIDHLTLALSPRVFRRIERILESALVAA